MARKKKIEEIKDAPIVKAIIPDPEPEVVSQTKSYMINDKWPNFSKENHISAKITDGNIDEVLINGEPAGGGGATATVVVTNNSAERFISLAVPFANEYFNGYASGGIKAIDSANPETINVLLNDGGAFLYFPEGVGTLVLTGDIAEDDGDVFVTGDGTITITD